MVEMEYSEFELKYQGDGEYFLWRSGHIYAMFFYDGENSVNVKNDTWLSEKVLNQAIQDIKEMGHPPTDKVIRN